MDRVVYLDDVAYVQVFETFMAVQLSKDYLEDICMDFVCTGIDTRTPFLVPTVQ